MNIASLHTINEFPITQCSILLSCQDASSSRSNNTLSTVLTRKSTENSSINRFVVKTTENLKQQLDIQMARFIFAANSAFRTVDHAEFKKLIEMLRPGWYKSPVREPVANELDEVYSSLEKNN